MKKIYDFLNLCFLFAGVYYEFSLWKILPEKIPVHFTLGGIPNRWANKGMEIILIFCMPWAMALLMYSIAKLARRYPSLLSIPRKQDFLALPSQQQEPLWLLIDEMMAGMAFAIIILFLGIIRFIEKAATGPVSGLSWEFMLGFGFFIVLAIAYVVKLNVKYKEILRNASQ
jgi:RsiW-degrading membrane proteinase PrsW (M82 family)